MRTFPYFSRAIRFIALVTFATPLLTGATAQAQTYTLSTLATFNGSGNGKYPASGLTFDAGGNLYGTVQSGGAGSLGTVFEIAAGTSALTTLAAFNSTNGAIPESSLLIDGSGNIYGTTKQGGANDVGTAFKIAAGTNTIATLATFNGANGSTPYGSLVRDSSGNLYGTTTAGGASSDGIVFKIAAGTNTLSTLATFNGANGANPYAGLTLDSSGNLYGVTSSGGASGDGTAFKIAAGTNTLTTLVNFSGTSNGANPYGNLMLDGSGNLYGMTTQGGANGYGTVFKIAAGTSNLATLIDFNGNNGISASGGLTLDSSGNLYGTTAEGGNLALNGGVGDGTVFKIAAGTGTLSTIATFTGTANGQYPQGGVAIDSSGNLYGTTNEGGSTGYGTVFKLTLSGGAATPEPGTLALLLPLLLPVARRFRRRGASR